MAMSPCHQLREAGTSVWLDQLSRELIQSGKLAELIQSAALGGVTSNPAIFHQAMTTGNAYDAQLMELGAKGLSDEQAYEELAVTDIRLACDTLRPVHKESMGTDGFVSLEVSPHLARDTQGTLTAARRLYRWVNRPNLMIKIPGTTEGVSAIEECLYEGIPINVTLLFSIDAYEAVAKAYVRAIARRVAEGKSPKVPSVASFFVSRIDSLTDQRLDEAAERQPAMRPQILSLRGKTAVANAKLAYQSFRKIFGTDQWKQLAGAGAWVQRPLWASTSTKNPAYKDTLYVDTLVGMHCVNTMPMDTIVATQDHGKIVANTIESDLEGARELFGLLGLYGISFQAVTDQLLNEAIQKFNDPYDKLLASLGSKMGSLAGRS